MSNILRAVRAVSLVVMALSIGVTMSLSASQGTDCVEPWRETCWLSTEACVSCNDWCMHWSKGSCKEEFSFCGYHQQCDGLNPPAPVLEVCTCEPE